MKYPFRQRALNFERMEERLALSTSTNVDFSYPINALTTDQGGYVVVGQNVSQVLSSVLNYDGHPTDIIVRLDGDHQWIMYSSASDVISMSEAFNGRVFPIAQPHIGSGKMAQGIVSLAEIFRPSTLRLESEPKLAAVEPFMEMAQFEPKESNWTTFTLERARDVHFEVAGREEREVIRHDPRDGLSQEQIKAANFEEPAVTQEADQLPPTPAKPTKSQPEIRVIRVSELREISPERVSHEEAPRRAQDKAISHLGDETTYSQQAPTDSDEMLSNITPRDQVLADWRRDESRIGASQPLLAQVADDYWAVWPVLTAVVGGGWLVKARRSRTITKPSRCDAGS